MAGLAIPKWATSYSVAPRKTEMRDIWVSNLMSPLFGVPIRTFGLTANRPLENLQVTHECRAIYRCSRLMVGKVERHNIRRCYFCALHGNRATGSLYGDYNWVA